jgi:hypothetical protein
MFDGNVYECYLKYAKSRELETDTVSRETFIQMCKELNYDAYEKAEEYIITNAWNKYLRHIDKND